MATQKAQLQHLGNVALFTEFSQRELKLIVRAGHEITMTAGSVIIEQGQTGREAFVILDGRAVVRRGGRKVATLSSGGVVGEMSLLDHGPRTATVVCETDCELFVIDQRHFRELLEQSPKVSLKLLTTLAGRVRELDRQYYG